MSFSTRVELHDATRDDYTKLHEKMRVQGFSTTIKGSDGYTYKLPPAEYRYEGYGTANDVLTKAKTAAGAVKPKFAVFNTEGGNCNWFGLEKVSSYAGV